MFPSSHSVFSHSFPPSHLLYKILLCEAKPVFYDSTFERNKPYFRLVLEESRYVTSGAPDMLICKTQPREPLEKETGIILVLLTAH